MIPTLYTIFSNISYFLGSVSDLIIKAVVTVLALIFYPIFKALGWLALTIGRIAFPPTMSDGLKETLVCALVVIFIFAVLWFLLGGGILYVSVWLIGGVGVFYLLLFVLKWFIGAFIFIFLPYLLYTRVRDKIIARRAPKAP